MVRIDYNSDAVVISPECTCNEKRIHIDWRVGIDDTNGEILQKATDHEELHKLADDIMDYLIKNGFKDRNELIEAFPDYKEGQIGVAANLAMLPIEFPRRRKAPPKYFLELKKHAKDITEEYRKEKYADDNREDTKDEG